MYALQTVRCCQIRTAQQGAETRQANPGITPLTHPRGRSPGQLPSGLQLFPGLGGVRLGLRQQELLGSILPRRAFAGRSGEIVTVGGARGLVVIPFWEGSSQSLVLRCWAAQRLGARGCFCLSCSLALQRVAQSLQWYFAHTWRLAWLVRGTTLLSWALAWSCVLEPRVCKRTQTTGLQ